MSLVREDNGKVSSRRVGGLICVVSAIVFLFLFTFLEKSFSIWSPTLMIGTGMVLLGYTTVDKILQVVKSRKVTVMEDTTNVESTESY